MLLLYFSRKASPFSFNVNIFIALYGKLFDDVDDKFDIMSENESKI